MKLILMHTGKHKHIMAWLAGLIAQYGGQAKVADLV